MSYTQSTNNLGLPQFQTNDVPTWGDINTAFALIDVLVGAIADKYDATSTYDEGDIVQYEGGLYKAKEDITVAEAWDTTHWDAILLTTEMKDVTDLTDFVKVDLTSGAGISTNQYAHLTVVS